MVQDPSLLVGFRVCSRLQVVYALVCFENIRCRVVELEDILGFTDWKENGGGVNWDQRINPISPKPESF